MHVRTGAAGSVQAAEAVPGQDLDPSAEAGGRRRPLEVSLLIQPMGWGGAELHTIDLARNLASRGHSVTIVVIGGKHLDEFEAARDRNFAVLGLDPGAPTERLGVRRWYRLFKSLPGDVAVMAKGWVYSGTPSFDLAARLAFGRYVTIEHMTPPGLPARSSRRHFGGLIPGVGLWWYRHREWIRARSWWPHRMFTVSDAIGNEYVADYGYPRRKLVTVRNGIDAGRFRYDPAARTALRAAWGIPQDALVLGAVTRLARRHKGLDILLDLFGRLREDHPGRGLWCALIGDGPDRALLEAQAGRLDIADCVVFAGHTERPWAAQSVLDVFLMPSRFEGIGLSLMEAMACERVPVAMGVGGVKEVITDPALGWLVPGGDTEAFYRAMCAAIELSPEERLARGRRARDHIVRDYDAQRQFSTLARLIEETAYGVP